MVWMHREWAALKYNIYNNIYPGNSWFCPPKTILEYSGLITQRPGTELMPLRKASLTPDVAHTCTILPKLYFFYISLYRCHIHLYVSGILSVSIWTGCTFYQCWVSIQLIPFATGNTPTCGYRGEYALHVVPQRSISKIFSNKSEAYASELIEI